MKTSTEVKNESEKGKITTETKIESFLKAKSTMISWMIVALTFLMGYLLFDCRLSFATDDATYINNALAFLKLGNYPHFQGALWPFILALLIKVGGVKLLTFKFVSLCFMTIGNWALYKGLKDKISYTLLISAMLTIAFNAYIQAYSSATFSEALFIMVQSFAIWTFCSLVSKLEITQDNLKSNIIPWLLFGFTFFVLTLAKNLALFGIVAPFLYFIFRKKWMNSIYVLVFFALFKVPYQVLVVNSFPKPAESQSDLLLRKDYYDASKGNEDISGFQTRFIDNYGQYVSIHIFKMLGLRGKGIPTLWTFDKMKELDEQNKMEGSFLLGLVFLILAGLTIYRGIKDQSIMLFIGLYIIALMGVTFLALQTMWNQDRLMIIFLPLMIPLLISGLESLGKTPKYQWMNIAVPIICVIFILPQIGTSLKEFSTNKGLKYFQKGDVYGQYPPAFQSYLKTCSWIKDNIKDSGFVIAFKPIESSVFGGISRFKKMPQPLPQTPDSMMTFFAKNKCHYILADYVQGQNIQLIEYLQKTNPNLIKEIHREGDYESCILYQLNN